MQCMCENIKAETSRLVLHLRKREKHPSEQKHVACNFFFWFFTLHLVFQFQCQINTCQTQVGTKIAQRILILKYKLNLFCDYFPEIGEEMGGNSRRGAAGVTAGHQVEWELRVVPV